MSAIIKNAFVMMLVNAALICYSQTPDNTQPQRVLEAELLFLSKIPIIDSNPAKMPYIPTLDTGLVWYIAMKTEFVGYHINTHQTRNIITHNDTVYFEYIGSDLGSLPLLIREDTVQQKIYNSDISLTDNHEILLYDYTLQVGDSICDDVFHVYTFLDSIRVESIFGTDRRVFYFNANLDWTNRFNPIWIEGIGSLSGFLNPARTPSYYGTGFTALNCCYKSNNLLYQTYAASIYGCGFETLDLNPPVLHNVWFDKDTVAFSDTIRLYIQASDPSGISGIAVLVCSPSGVFHHYNGYIAISDSLFKITINELNESKFWNEVGTWYLCMISLSDNSGNFYSDYPVSCSFYVSEISATDEYVLLEPKFYPNPMKSSSAFYLTYDLGLNSIKIYDVYGNMVWSKTTSEGIVPIGNVPLTGGIYFYTIQQNALQLIKGKFIVY
jgi:hypothetical protein